MNSNVVAAADGMAATMPAKMMSEMRLPIPALGDLLPSHMMKPVPVVVQRDIIVISRKVPSRLETTPRPPRLVRLRGPDEMKSLHSEQEHRAVSGV